MRFCPTCQRCFNTEIQFCLFDQSPTREVRDVPLVLEGKYRLERLIAHGGMGSVYRGVHEQLERPIAVKILRAEFLQDETVRARFHREALAAARLKHPNIIAVYDFGVLKSGGAYLVMELVEGRSLREEMRLNAARNGQMRPERAAAILRQVCAGVEAAHQSGIIHRDLKPDNIMIEPLVANDLSGSSERILVLDFGIAKLKQLEGAWQGLTEENVIIGTPNYISPEQCAGAPVEARSDVYALGVILYEMLTGRVPFNNVSTSAVLLSHLQDAPLPPTKYRPDLTPAVERVMLRALAKNPAHRFASAAQLADALTRALTAPGRHEIEEEWPDELPHVPPTPRGSEMVDEPATRPRQPRPLQPAAALEPEQPVEFEWAEPSRPDGKLSRRLLYEDDDPAISDEIEMDGPQLLVEPPQRRWLFITMAVFMAAASGLAIYFSNITLPYSWRESARNLAVSAGLASPPPAALPQPAPTAPAVSSPTPENILTGPLPAGSPGLAAAEAGDLSLSHEALEKEVRSFYRQWAQSALDQNWTAHAQTYADKVDYYRDGSVARASVMTRKQRVLTGLQRTYLKFAAAPQIVLRERDGVHEAEVTFDKSWDLLRGQQRTAGKAQTQLTLHRVALQRATAGTATDAPAVWRIVRERQLKLYDNVEAPEARPVSQVPPAGPKVAGKATSVKPVHQGVPAKYQTKPGLAKSPAAGQAPVRKPASVEAVETRPRIVPRPRN